MGWGNYIFFMGEREGYSKWIQRRQGCKTSHHWQKDPRSPRLSEREIRHLWSLTVINIFIVVWGLSNKSKVETGL